MKQYLEIEKAQLASTVRWYFFNSLSSDSVKKRTVPQASQRLKFLKVHGWQLWLDYLIQKVADSCPAPSKPLKRNMFEVTNRIQIRNVWFHPKIYEVMTWIHDLRHHFFPQLVILSTFLKFFHQSVMLLQPFKFIPFRSEHVFFCRFCGTNFVSNSGTLGSQISSAASSHPQKLGWWTVINNLRISTIAAFPPSVKNDEQILPQMVKITSASTISTLKPPPFSNNNRPGRWPVWRPSSVLRRPVQPLWTAWAMGSRRSWRTLARIWVWWWLGERCSLGANHLGWS